MPNDTSADITTGLTSSLSEQDQRFLAVLDDLPIVPKPWDVIAQELDRAKDELLDRLARWFDADGVRHLRAMFNSRKIGYEATLIGMAVGGDEADRIAEQIAAMATVSHNFLREGCKYNLWFTLTCPPKNPSLVEAIDEIKNRFQKPLIRLDTTEYFKISFSSVFHRGPKPSWTQQPSPAKEMPREVLLRAIDVLQTDLPLLDRPFEAIAADSGLTESQLIDAALTLKHHGIIRRVGAVLNLPNLTQIQNVMCVWDLPEHQVDAFARKAADHPRISHCYRRNVYPDWPWKLYTVIHGRDRDDCMQIIADLAQNVPEAKHMPLWTRKEYKQTPVRYDPEKIVLP